MADETVFAVLDETGLVVNQIVAEQEFIDSIADQINDSSTDTGSLSVSHKFIDVTGKDPRPGVGWRRAANGKFVAPPPVQPTPAELAARTAAEAAQARHDADDARILFLRTKVGPGKSGLTQDERDELMVLQLARTIT